MRNWTVWLTSILLVASMGLGICQAQEVVNIAVNGGFENGDLTAWGNYANNTADGAIEVVTELTGAAIPESPIEGDYCLHVTIGTVGTEWWDAGFNNQSSYTFEQGKYYTLSVFLKSAKGEFEVNIKPEHAGDPYEGYGETRVTITEEWKEYSVTTPVFPSDVSPASLTFHYGIQAPGEFWVDAVRLYEGDYVRPAFLGEVAASKPSPVDGGTDVARDYTVLNWEPDPLAGTHNVYFGETFADVNAAEAGNIANVTFSLGQDANALALEDRLEFDRMYYWRVDEVNATPDNTVFKGAVWSFQVEPQYYAIPRASITATASSVGFPTSTADKTIDGSGLNAQGQHSMDTDSMWLSTNSDSDISIEYAFDKVYKLYGLKIWNSNQSMEPFLGVGAKNVTIETSLDGVTWSVFGTVELERASGDPTYEGAPVIDMNGTAAQSIRLNIQDNWGGILGQAGVSEVQFMYAPMLPRYEKPASGSSNVSPDATLSWRPGRKAGQHLIYLGTNVNELVLVDTASDPSLDLSSIQTNLGTTYYWRVDEVNETEIPSMWAGPVWGFSTPAAVIVDNFERYTNVTPNRPFQTWLDGYGYSADEFFPVKYPGNGTGAGVGHDIWNPASPYFDGDIMETSIARGGRQSLPFYYDNSSGASHTDRNWSTPQDWSRNGIQSLVLYVYGDPGNTGDALYVTINGVKVTNQDTEALTTPEWHLWAIDLASLGTNLSAVTSMSIGVEGAGSGMILVDDIALYRTVPVPLEGVVYDFETGTQGWGPFKDGINTTVSSVTHSTGGLQSLRSTIDEAAYDQQQGGWMSSRDFTAAQAGGGLKSMSFWYRVDDPDFNGGNFICHWEESTETWSGGAWYGNGLYGVVIADGQWHQQTLDLSILGAAGGGWQGAWGELVDFEFRDDLFYAFSIGVESSDNTTGSDVYIDDIVFSTDPLGTVFDFETDAQGWGNLKDGTSVTVSSETRSGGQSLQATIDEAAHEQQEGGWTSPRVFTAAEASGGIKTLSFWYRVDDPDMNGGNFIFNWIMSTETWTGGGWYGNGLWGVLIADGQWHQQTADLSILGADAGGWQGAWGDQTAWDFRDDLYYNFELMVSPTDNASGSTIYIDDIVFK